MKGLCLSALLLIGCVSTQNYADRVQNLGSVTHLSLEGGATANVFRHDSRVLINLIDGKTTYIDDHRPFGVLNFNKDKISIEHNGQILEWGNSPGYVLVVDENEFSAMPLEEVRSIFQSEFKRIYRAIGESIE